jgi:hypothetical protein
MRIPIAIVAVAALAPVLFLTGCGGASGLPASEPASSSSPIATPASATPTPKATQSAVPTPVPHPTTAPTGGKQPTTTDPRPPSPPSTGLIPVTTWKGTPAAKRVYVDDLKIVAYAPDGHVLGNWPLPGNLPAIVAGLTTAFGHSPLATVNGTAGWKYTWDGFIIYDDTPEVVGPTDPAYQWDVTVSHVDGVLVETASHISVGTSGDAAAAIADTSSVTGFFVAEFVPVPLSVPTTGSPRLWVEAIGGATQHAPIVELRGPVASWLS